MSGDADGTLPPFCWLVTERTFVAEASLVRVALEAAGTRVVTTETPIDAGAEQGDIVVLVDGDAARGTVARVIPALRQHRVRLPAVPILVVSADTRPESAAACLEAGARDYIRIPFHGAELCARVKVAIAHFRRLRTERTVLFDHNACDVLIDERVVTLRSDAFAVLVHLHEMRERWCATDEVRVAVLGSHLSKRTSNVRWHVLELRRALGEEHWWVHSDRKLGYMFSFRHCKRSHCTSGRSSRQAGPRESGVLRTAAPTGSLREYPQPRADSGSRRR